MIGERGEIRRRARALGRQRLALALALFALPACSAVLGLRELPARTEDADAGASTDGGDATPGAVSGFCAGAGGLFCDDFDDPDAEVGVRWSGLPSFGFRSVNVTEDAGSLSIRQPVAPELLPVSAPAILEAVATRDDEQVTAILVHGVDPAPASLRVLEAEADVRLLSVVDLRDGGMAAADAAPAIVYAYPRLPVLGMFVVYDATGADLVEAVFSSRYIALGSSELSLSPQRSDEYATALEGDILSLSRTFFLHITLATGARDAVVARQAETGRADLSCPETAAVAALWTQGGGAACLSVPDRVANLGGKLVGITAGLVLNDRSSARVQLDNVRVLAIP